jgi:hypothetical protein
LLDFYQPFVGRQTGNDRRLLRISRWLTAVWGVADRHRDLARGWGSVSPSA